MKHLKDGALSYLFYLVGTFIFLIAVMTLDGSITSPFSIRLSNILNYIDLGSLVFILAFCLLALACTKTMRPLKDAFVFMFQEQDYTVQQLSEYLLSIKAVSYTHLCCFFLTVQLCRLAGNTGKAEPPSGIPAGSGEIFPQLPCSSIGV